jgi:hypothetical protein
MEKDPRVKPEGDVFFKAAGTEGDVFFKAAGPEGDGDF